MKQIRIPAKTIVKEEEVLDVIHVTIFTAKKAAVVALGKEGLPSSYIERLLSDREFESVMELVEPTVKTKEADAVIQDASLAKPE